MDLSFSNTMISAVAVLPDCIYAATDQGLWVTRDRGIRWENALASLGKLEPFAVTSVISAVEKKGSPVVVAGVSGGFLRSEDGGRTWNFIALPSPQPLVTALTADANQVLYAGTALDGIFISKDSGKSWERWNFGLLDWHVFTIAASNGADGSQLVCAGTETGVFYSRNQGRTWLESDFPIDVGAVLALSACSRLSGDLVIAATETGRIYRSLDQGKTWERCADEGFEGEINPVVLSSDQSIAANQGQLLHSRDGGLHWLDLDADISAQPVLSLALVNGPESKIQICVVSADRSIQVMDYIPA